MRINEEWHRQHVMPKKPSLETRIAWHLEHAKNCSCRPITGKLADEMQKRGIAIPERQG